jgi:hypothetical protein
MIVSVVGFLTMTHMTKMLPCLAAQRTKGCWFGTDLERFIRNPLASATNITCSVTFKLLTTEQVGSKMATYNLARKGSGLDLDLTNDHID